MNETPALDKLTDSDLLEIFSRTQEELAFAELVQRHSNLVMSVCLRALGNRHDAEDAFQATFLVLAQRCSKIKKKTSLPSWLYGVAYRVSINLGRKRHRRDKSLTVEPMTVADPFAEFEHRFDQQVVDEELNRLPEKYRDTLVLYYLKGRTSREIAEELGVTQGKVDGQIKRGRQELRVRLARRGVALVGALGVLGLSAQKATAAVAPSLIQATAKAAGCVSAGTAPTGLCTQTALELAKNEVWKMAFMKPAFTVCAAATLLLAVSSLGLNAANAGPGGGGQQSLADAIQTEVSLAEASEARALLTNQDKTTDNPFGGATTVAATPPVKAYTPPSKKKVAAPPSFVESIAAGGQATRKTHAKIEAALAGPSLDITGDQSLAAVFSFIADNHGFAILPDKDALRQIGIDNLDSVQVSEDFNLSDVTLANAFELLFENLAEEYDDQLDILVENQVVKITTRMEATQQRHHKIRLYETRALSVNAVTLVELIESTFADDFLEGGGDGIVRQVGTDKLMVRHNRRVHIKIADLIAQLTVKGGDAGAEK